LSSSFTSLTGYTHGNGEYVVTSSSEYYTVEYNWKAFNALDNPDCQNNLNIWTVYKYWYYASDGLYAASQSTVISSQSYSGEWLQIKLPQPIILKKYTLYTRGDSLSRGPKTFYIAGSSDGSNWHLVDSKNDETPFTEEGKSYDLANTTTLYSYYRIVVTAKFEGDSWLSICEWFLWGSEQVNEPPYTCTKANFN
jgi:hypothetical protein